MEPGFFIRNRKWLRPTGHVVFWIAYFLFMLVQYVYMKDDVNYRALLASLSMTLPVDIAATYFTVYYLMPRFLFRRKYVTSMLVFAFSAVVFILLQRCILYFIIIPTFHQEKWADASFFPFNFFYSLINIYMVTGFFMAVKLLKFWYEDQHIRTELETQNKESELALLRSQINPHFLFNTLNNIDTLIADNAEEASAAIMKLSDIMRYMLFDSDTRFVPLSKEITYLESYVSLQKIRFRDPDFVKFEVRGSERNRMIAPMLLIPFVENAFKHGAKEQDRTGISIFISSENNLLEFEVVNSLSPDSPVSKDITKGIGLTNVIRRLDLLYKDRYQLTTSTENNKFRVHLRIILYED